MAAETPSTGPGPVHDSQPSSIVSWLAGVTLGAGQSRPGRPREGAAQAEELGFEAVRAHQLELFAGSFPRFVLGFALASGLASATVLALCAWMVVSLVQEFDLECESPLKMWVIVDIASSVYQTGHGFILNYYLFQELTDHRTRTMPRCERVHTVVVTLLDIAWLVIGASWSLSPATDCRDEMPRLQNSIASYTTSSLALSVLVVVNAVGLFTVMNRMMQRGLLRTQGAAPEGTVTSLPLVAFDGLQDVFKESPDCCICLAPFSADVPIRQTSCGHHFHEKCLGNWLKMSRTCPLCRRNVTHGLVAHAVVPDPLSSEAGIDAASAQVPQAAPAAQTYGVQSQDV